MTAEFKTKMKFIYLYYKINQCQKNCFFFSNTNTHTSTDLYFMRAKNYAKQIVSLAISHNIQYYSRN